MGTLPLTRLGLMVGIIVCFMLPLTHTMLRHGQTASQVCVGLITSAPLPHVTHMVCRILCLAQIYAQCHIGALQGCRGLRSGTCKGLPV
jgi:hypothetical protein